MDSVGAATVVLQLHKRRYDKFSQPYKLDMWREIQKRWLVLGVLMSITLAVLAPRVGAPGGPLHTELLSYLPLSYIYFEAGRARCATGVPRPAHLALSATHAHVVAPMLCLFAVTAFKDVDIDHRVIRGALFSSVGGPCAWLSVSLCGGAAPLAAANYVTSLLATPLAMLVMCGRATVPPLGGVLSTALTTLTPYALGATRPQPPASDSGDTTKLAALLLLYADCCQRLSEAEGSLYVGDVLVTMFLELTYLLFSAASCYMYARCGLLTGSETHALALSSIPKLLELGWESSTTCTPSGLSRLPSVFLAPAQALLLAAISASDDRYRGEDDYANGLAVVDYELPR